MGIANHNRRQPQSVESTPTRTEELDLERVLELARAHDADALAEIYRRYVRRVFGLCRYLLGSSAAAEDATSEVFLKLQQLTESYDGFVPFPNWLLRVAANQCIDALRRKKRGQQVFVEVDVETAAEPVSAGPSPLGVLISAEERAVVRKAVDRLPENYRFPLVLRYYSDLSYEEIAGQLGLHRNHVATLIFRAKRELRHTLAHRRK